MDSRDLSTIGAALLIVGFVDVVVWEIVAAHASSPWPIAACIVTTVALLLLSRIKDQPHS